MADISQAMQAKSDQLNALDIIGSPLVIKVRGVDYKQGREQPVWVYFDGDNNRPWKPSKGMIRVLCGAWGTETDAWIYRYARLEYESSVVYAGKEVGGIWVKAMTDIPEKGMMFSLAINRSKRIPFPVEFLKVEVKAYPQDKFDTVKQAMIDAMQSGKMTLPQVIAQCQKTGQLTAEQLRVLEQNAPIEEEGHADEPQLNTQQNPQSDNATDSAPAENTTQLQHHEDI